MQDLQPKPPKNLNPLARELLESLAGHPEAAEIVLGGGVALSHYLEDRDTVDVDAWWRTGRVEATMRLVERCMRKVAAKHCLAYHRRTWGETECIDLLRCGQRAFSFKISSLTLFLDAPISAEWQPLSVEALRDNVGSKMTALVVRGAPGDYRDIYELVHQSIISVADCWYSWGLKNPGVSEDEAKQKVCARLDMAEAIRPVANTQPETAREKAVWSGSWFRTIFIGMPGSMNIDHSVYPDLAEPPMELVTMEDKRDYLQRICGAFDFGIFPEESDWQTFAGWKDVFDRFPIADSPGYHTFRHWYRWEPVPHEKRIGIPAWKISDINQGRIDLCEEMV